MMAIVCFVFISLIFVTQSYARVMPFGIEFGQEMALININSYERGGYLRSIFWRTRLRVSGVRPM